MKFSYIYGIRFLDWMRLLIESGFHISPEYLGRTGVITLCSLVNSILGGLENILYGSRIKNVKIESDPLFILGHPRSGTTHLHNLLILDSEFASPTFQEAFFPHTFLFAERTFKRIFSPLLPETRGIDRMDVKLESPQEEEVALCSLGSLSVYMSLLFPHRLEHYMKYLNLQDLTAEEKRKWKNTYVEYLKKLTYKFNRRLVLKSTPHTAKISTLLELFPDAKFVHISRHPYQVFQSYRNLLIYMSKHFLCFQKQVLSNLNDIILDYYSKMYNAFFNDLPLLSNQQFHTIKLEDLEKSPLSEIEALYGQLDLQGFDMVRPNIKRYLDQISGYQKNKLKELSPEEKKIVLRTWKKSFDAWGYSYQ